MKLPKLPIDYSKAGTGEAPFDGAGVLLHKNDVVLGYFAYDLFRHGVFIELHSGKKMTKRTNCRATHWSPMPEFIEVTDPNEDIPF